MNGLLVEVIEDTRGSQATEVALVNGDQVHVEDLTAFPETGGIVDILGEQYAYTEVIPDPETIDPDTLVPDTAGTIVLGELLRVQVDVDDPVRLVLGGAPATDAYAVVEFPAPTDSDQPDDIAPVHVPIDFSQRPMFAPGPYEPAVPIEVSDDLTRVITVPGVKPTIDGSTIVDLPGSGPTAPPAASPAARVEGTPNALLVITEDIEPSTELEYHVSTTAGFTPGPGTLLEPVTRSTVCVITTLPDMTPLGVGQTYYVRVVAKNDLGAAAPSPEVPGALSFENLDEFVVARIVAGFVLAGALQVGNITIDPDQGIQIPQPDGGTIHLPTDGATIARITAHLVAKSLNVEDNLVIGGAGKLNGELTVAAGVTKPTTSPSMSFSIPSLVAAALSSNGTTDQGDIYNGLCQTATPGVLATAISFFGGGVRMIHARTGDNAAFPDPTSGKAWAEDFYIRGGIAYDSVRNVYYVLGSDLNRSANWYLYIINGSTWDKITEVYFWTDANVGAYTPKIAYSTHASAVNKLYVLFTKSDNVVYLRTYPISGTGGSTAFGTHSSDTGLETTVARHAIGDVEVGAFDGASASVAWRLKTTASVRVRQLTSLGSEPSDVKSFNLGHSRLQGLTWDAQNSRFVSLDNYGKLWFYSDFRAATTVRGSYTWYDPQSNTLAWDEGRTAGTHETEEGPYREFTVPARAWAHLETAPPPDANNTDPSNTDKANAAGIYIGTGTGTRYLQQTVGRSVRQVSVQVDDGDPSEDWLQAHNTGGPNTFTSDDIGATVTGTHIQAGTTITAVTQAGQRAILSKPTTVPAGAPVTITATITHASVKRNLRPRKSLATGTGTPPLANGFASAAITPGLVRSAATNVGGDPLWVLDGGGSAEFSHPYALYSSTGQGTLASGGAPGTDITTGWTGTARDITFAGGTWTVSRGGLYQIVAYASFAGNGTGQRTVTVWLNGVQYGGQLVGASGTSNSMGPRFVDYVALVPGDALKISCSQSSGGNLANNAAQFRLVYAGRA